MQSPPENSNSASRARARRWPRLALAALLGGGLLLLAWVLVGVLAPRETRLMQMADTVGQSRLLSPTFIDNDHIVGFRLRLPSGRFSHFAVVNWRSGQEERLSRPLLTSQYQDWWGGIRFSPDARWVLWSDPKGWWAASLNGKITRHWPAPAAVVQRSRTEWQADGRGWLSITTTRSRNPQPPGAGWPFRRTVDLLVDVHSLDSSVPVTHLNLGPATSGEPIPRPGGRLLYVAQPQTPSGDFAAALYSLDGRQKPHFLTLRNNSGRLRGLYLSGHACGPAGRFALFTVADRPDESGWLSRLKSYLGISSRGVVRTALELLSNRDGSAVTELPVPADMRRRFEFLGWNHDGSQVIYYRDGSLWSAPQE